MAVGVAVLIHQLLFSVKKANGPHQTDRVIRIEIERDLNLKDRSFGLPPVVGLESRAEQQTRGVDHPIVRVFLDSKEMRSSAQETPLMECLTGQ
jgi:hypothetical protein